MTPSIGLSRLGTYSSSDVAMMNFDFIEWPSS